MAKVAIIGAGSIVFCQTLMLDILGAPGLEGTEFALMAPSTNRTAQVEAFAKRVIADNKLPAKVWKTTDRRAALDGADYVIATFQVGGMQGFEADYKIPYLYGVDQCIGDTLGPGGIFRTLRSVPTVLGMAQDIKEVAPEAYVLNYVNPMATICWTLGTTGVKFVGLLSYRYIERRFLRIKETRFTAPQDRMRSEMAGGEIRDPGPGPLHPRHHRPAPDLPAPDRPAADLPADRGADS